MKLFFVIALSFFSSVAFTAIPSARYVAHELAKNSGSGSYQIEQDVVFPTGADPIVLRETWWVDSDGNMRVSISGTRELKNQVHMQFIYRSGLRSFWGAQGKQQTKISEDFFEKYFHARSSEKLLIDFVAQGFLKNSALQRKTIRNLKEIDFQPDEGTRLARSGGSLSYFFGEPSAPEGAGNPGIWIEQDAFVIKKMRLRSQTEVTAEKHSLSARGLMFPRTRTVRWGPSSATIQTVNVASKASFKNDFFQNSNLDFQNKIEGIENSAVKSSIEEFYLRFR